MSKLAQIVVVALTFLVVFGVGTLWASGAPEAVVNQQDGVAIKGYDPVAYFTEGRPVKGTDEFTVEYDGAVWHFSSAEHRDLFLSDPEKYAPAYGGYCAWAVSNGDFADIDPEQWVIHGGTLYLNFDARTNTRFNEDLSGNIQKAEDNWPEMKGRIEEGS